MTKPEFKNGPKLRLASDTLSGVAITNATIVVELALLHCIDPAEFPRFRERAIRFAAGNPHPMPELAEHLRELNQETLAAIYLMLLRQQERPY